MTADDKMFVVLRGENVHLYAVEWENNVAIMAAMMMLRCKFSLSIFKETIASSGKM